MVLRSRTHVNTKLGSQQEALDLGMDLRYGFLFDKIYRPRQQRGNLIEELLG